MIKRLLLILVLLWPATAEAVLFVKNGQTSNIVDLPLQDSSSSTGAWLTGLTSASTGLSITVKPDNGAGTIYTVAGSTIEAVTTIGTFSAPTATKVRFKETTTAGLYELQIADAQYATSNARYLTITVSGATNLVPNIATVQLTGAGFDPMVAAQPANVIQANGVAAESVGGYFRTQPENGRVWYVTTTGNDSAAGTRAAPFLTVGHAVGVVSHGDTIHVGPGEFDESVNLTTTGVTIEGEGDIALGGTGTLILNSTSTYTIQITHGDHLKNLQIQATHATGGVGAVASGSIGAIIEHCSIDGTFDGIQATGTYGLNVDGCIVSGTYDGGTIASSIGCRIANTKFTSSGAYGTSTLTKGLFAGSVNSCIFDNVIFVADRASAATADTIGLVIQNYSSTIPSTVYCRNCQFIAIKSNANGTGLVKGLSYSTPSPQAINATLDGCLFKTSNAGSGAVYDIDANQSGSKVVVERTVLDTTKLNGAANIHVVDSATDLVNGAINTMATAFAAMQSGNVFTAPALANAPSGTGASAASIRAEMDSNSTQLAKLGTPAATISADIAAIQADTDNIQTRLPTALTAGGNMKADSLKLNGTDPATLIAANSGGGITTQDVYDQSYAATLALTVGAPDLTPMIETANTLATMISGGAWTQASLIHGPATSSTASDINEDPVPEGRTWRLLKSSLLGDKINNLTVGDAPIFALDFANDLSPNDYVYSVAAPTIVTGASDGITFGTTGRDHSKAKVQIVGVTAGTYVITIKVTYRGGATRTGRVTLSVKN